MTTNTERSGVHRRPPKFIRMIKARPRLFISVAIGTVVAFVFAAIAQSRFASSLLIGWDVCCGLYLAFAFHIMSKANVQRMRRQARLQDEGQFGILILTA